MTNFASCPKPVIKTLTEPHQMTSTAFFSAFALSIFLILNFTCTKVGADQSVAGDRNNVNGAGVQQVNQSQWTARGGVARATGGSARAIGGSGGSAQSSTIVNLSDPREIKRRGIEVKYRLEEIAKRSGLARSDTLILIKPGPGEDPKGADSDAERFRSLLHKHPEQISTMEFEAPHWVSFEVAFGLSPRIVIESIESLWTDNSPVFLYEDLRVIPTSKLVYQLELESPNPKACLELEREIYRLEQNVRLCRKLLVSSKSAQELVTNPVFERLTERLGSVTSLAYLASEPTVQQEQLSNLKVTSEALRYLLEETKANMELNSLEQKLRNQDPANVEQQSPMP
ncbi:MAG TPA: hypothetical protein V6C81_07300 [Planktothrix sp.]|jgi:hypothetical protein